MPKRLLLLACLFLSTTIVVLAQRDHSKKNLIDNNIDNSGKKDSVYKKYNTPPPEVVKPARDFLMIMGSYNDWVAKPDTVKTKPFNYGFQTYLCYDFPIKQTKFSFATGLGINIAVSYLDQQQLKLSDTASTNAAAKFVPDSTHYSRYKFVTTYLSAPFEIRYFSNQQNRNKGFKMSAGLQVGLLVGAHTKAVETINGSTVNFKVDTRRYISPWSFAASMRVGWGNFSIFGNYNLTTIFKENEGPAITPMNLGICLTGL